MLFRQLLLTHYLEKKKKLEISMCESREELQKPFKFNPYHLQVKKWKFKKSVDLSKITQLINVKAEIESQVLGLLSRVLWPTFV